MVKKNKSKRFPLALGIYALVFLLLVAVGLWFFWDFIDTYEHTRLQVTTQQYLEQLTAEHICDASESLIDQIDHNIQTVDQCRKTIMDALQSPFTLAKRPKESNDTTQVYSVVCNRRTVGVVTFRQQGQTQYGLTPWVMTHEQFDLSFLKTEAVTLTVPADFTVRSFGNALSADYMIDTQVPYPSFGKLYTDYDLPYLVTYTAGPFLGQPDLTTSNSAGEEVTVNANTDMNQFLPGCTNAQAESLDRTVEAFLDSWVGFTSKRDSEIQANYQKLMQYVVPNSKLQDHAMRAFDGLYWKRDSKAVLTDSKITRYVTIAEGLYLCDVTYQFEENTAQGRLETTVNLQLILRQTDNGLKAELLINKE